MRLKTTACFFKNAFLKEMLNVCVLSALWVLIVELTRSKSKGN